MVVVLVGNHFEVEGEAEAEDDIALIVVVAAVDDMVEEVIMAMVGEVVIMIMYVTLVPIVSSSFVAYWLSAFR